MSGRALLACALACAALSPPARADCQAADPSKVVLFLNVNASASERDAAEAGACARGETLVAVPAGVDGIGRLEEQNIPFEEVLHANNRACYRKTPMTPRCQRALDASIANTEKIRAERSRILGDASLDSLLKEKLLELARAHAAVTGLVISGHDGGSHFSGVVGILEFQKVLDALKVTGANATIDSIVLAGCYTAVPSEINKWKAGFPAAKLIAGYEGKAPRSVNEAGRSYLRDILAAARRLSAVDDDRRLQAMIRSGIPEMSLLNAAVWVAQAGCGPASLWGRYYRPGGRGLSSLPACPPQGELDRARDEVMKYYSGAIEPPKDSDQGPLRELYNLARRNGHCLGTHDVLEPEHVFALLFFDSVKKNIALALRSELKAFAADVDRYHLGNGAWIPTVEEMSRHSREEIMLNLNKLWELTSALPDPMFVGEKPSEGSRARERMENTLEMMENWVNCQGVPFAWHDFPPAG